MKSIGTIFEIGKYEFDYFSEEEKAKKNVEELVNKYHKGDYEITIKRKND